MRVFDFIRENRGFLSAGFLLTLSSCYGQTFFIAIFAAQIMASFGLSDGEWGALYTVATTASAVLMFWAGALTDRFRVRALAAFVFPGLAAVCVAMALNTSPIGLLVIVFLLRLLGQGMMFQLAATAMARWFVGRRGVAMSIAGLGFFVGQAFFPVAAATLLESLDWRILWLVAAGMTLFAAGPVLWLLAAERTPAALSAQDSATGMAGKHWTRAEVLRSPIFWLLLPALLGPPAWGTALFFQQVHIAEVKGWDLVDYLALVPMLTAISVLVTLVAGQVIDRFGSGRVMLFYMVPWIAGFALLSAAQSLFGAAVAMAVFGVATGLQATLLVPFWAEYFGTRHIGAIKAAAASIMVFGSAIGPGISGAMIDLGISFPDQMNWIAAYFALAFGLVAVAVTRADKALAPPQVDIERT